MTDERLAELEALCSAATPGPWEYRTTGEELTDAMVWAASGWAVAAMLMRGDLHPESDGFRDQASRNGPFIAAARLAVPELLAEVRRLRAELASREPPADMPVPPESPRSDIEMMARLDDRCDRSGPFG